MEVVSITNMDGGKRLIFRVVIPYAKQIENKDIVGSIIHGMGDILAPAIDLDRLIKTGEIRRFMTNIEFKKSKRLCAGRLKVDVNPVSYPADIREAVTALIAAIIENTTYVGKHKATFKLTKAYPLLTQLTSSQPGNDKLQLKNEKMITTISTD